jgi:hypothetical protein
MQLIDGVCQKHCPLVFLAGLLLVKEYATYVKFHRMCHLVFRAELVGGNMPSCYCSITECTKRQCKGMLKWNKKKFRSIPVICVVQNNILISCSTCPVIRTEMFSRINNICQNFHASIQNRNYIGCFL